MIGCRVRALLYLTLFHNATALARVRLYANGIITTQLGLYDRRKARNAFKTESH